MSMKSRFVLFVVLVAALVLTGCAGGFGGNEVTAVTAASVSATLQYVDGGKQGPAYNMTVTVPDDWVGVFDVQNTGNTLMFHYTKDVAEPALVFSIEALSPTQYWKASGSYPASQTNIVNAGDTYFVYHLPIDTFYSGLSAEQLATLSAAVPGIVASFAAEAAQ